MPRIEDIAEKGHELIPVPSLPWLGRAIAPGFTRGGVYLLAGEPGIGKTTLAMQVLGDFAMQGIRVLFLTTEQGLGDLKSAILRVHEDANGDLPQPIRENFFLDDSIDDIDALPRFLARRVLTEGEPYHDVQAIVVDSVQGRGLASTASQKYRALYEFAENAKAQGLVSILIGHVTKKGQIAGPKDLEHNVDCIMYIRRAFRLRPFFVPKNRFGPAVLDPLVLMMDNRGRLVESPHRAAKSAAVFGYAGIGEDLAEGQASVTLPRYGSRPELNAPFLPSKKVKQLLSVLSTIKEVDLTDLSYEINCYVPRQQRYREELDLPIAVALLSSYLQRPVPEAALFVGELDLTRRIRRPENKYLAALAKLLTDPQKGRIKRLYIAEECASELGKLRPNKDEPPVAESVEIVPVSDLERLLKTLWPDLFVED
ncbi:ATPase domain-containing protein [Chthonomonas calidirosea]|uniref:ATPase domain-containing protein n=1 Tax=Chthonomonas calidirosea TaxID=454171 RepID=UPI0006EC561E|nr:ATPase domain-containing protein [Chthonomonas calidirosea]CEK14056.1 predicted ATP-dependent serine protease [Chthonomonas calidirosea]